MAPLDVGPALPDLTIRQLEYLVAVAEAPTWAEAADVVGVSPSALSQGLAELERRVGVELFDRVGRRRVLRDDASPVLDHARQVLALTADLVRWAQRRRSGEIGHVRVGMIDVAAVVHYPEALRSFRADHPDVELVLTVAPSRALLEDLVAARLDLVVCVEPPASVPGVELEPAVDEPLVVLGPPGVGGPPSSWGPWVLFPAGSHTREAVERALLDRGATVDVVAESHQPDVLREMVLLGLGWTVLPTSQGSPGNGLVAHAELMTRRLVVARRSGAVRDPATDLLAAVIRVPGRGGGATHETSGARVRGRDRDRDGRECPA